MNCIIVDDEPLAREAMKLLIEESDNLQLIGSFNSAATASDFMEQQGVDLVFLDIEMPGMNGIFVGNELKKANKNVIIFVVTSYSEYLDEAMRFHVFRYLSKPLDKQRFFRNMKDALTYYNSITTKIPVETKQGVYSFPASQIIAIEAQGRKVIVHTARQDFDSIHNMDYWLEQLPKNSFFQTHRSFIINFEHIVDFDHSTIHLSNQQITAYLTRRKYSSFKNAYLLYLESMR